MKYLLETCMLLTVIACLTAAGCGSGQITNGAATLDADEGSAAYIDRLSSQLTVSEHDAMRGIIFLLDGKDSFQTFSQRAESLRDRGIIGAAWDVDADRETSRGRLAYMIYQAAEVRGGVTLMITGPNERYCLRELQYKKMMGEGAVFTSVTGLEFIGVLSTADTFIQTGKVPELAGHVE